MQTVKTNDGVQYKIQRDVLRLNSRLIAVHSEQQNYGDQLCLPFHSRHFDYIYQFLQLNKTQQKKISQIEYELVQRIMVLSQLDISEIINASFYLQMTKLKRLLAQGISNKTSKLQILPKCKDEVSDILMYACYQS